MRLGALLIAALVLGAGWLLLAPREEGGQLAASRPAAAGPRSAPPGDVRPTLPPVVSDSAVDAGLPGPILGVPGDLHPDEAVPTGPTGVVRGRVLDQGDAAVPDVTVSLYRGKEKRQAKTGAAGWYHFGQLPPGLYRLYVEPRDLPAGLLPPWRQQVVREREDDPEGVYGTAVRLTAGGERTADLRVSAAGVVRGRVVGPGGEPVPEAIVTILAASGVREAARTDDQGRYVIERVRPGDYTLTVALAGDRAASAGGGLLGPEVPPGPAAPAGSQGPDGGSDGVAPLPVRFDLLPGQTLDLADLVAGAGGHVLTGLVLDQDGLPVAGLRLRCMDGGDGSGAVLGRAVTDEAGRFRLGRVPSAALRIGVEAVEWEPDAAHARLGAEPGTLPADTRGASPDAALDVGILRVESRRPFRLLGRVRVDPVWAREHEFLRWDARVEVQRLDGLAAVADPDVPEPRVGPTGTFSWACATPHPDVELTVILRSPGGAEYERRERISPAADETQELVVTIP